jgi:serine/threonine-protein kinase
MGIVYLAERIDGQVEQRVAVKLAQQGFHGEDAPRRFLQERQILARLEHPAIARLLDAGVTDEGTPFFVMERVEGQPVTSYCSAHALPVDARLRLFLEICGAVQYAHRNLIVHRDLKPSNILVDDDARVKLLDFGIAKLLGAAQPAPDAPQTIVRALTPLYAAPEQLCGEPASTSADVYSLGVLLYELLTGELPYRPTSSAISEVERAILEQIPAPPSARVASAVARHRLKGDLDRIVLKALQKSPERRYQSAEALAADVRRHLDGLPVSAQGDALSYRARKFLGRHRVGAGAAALLVVTLVGGLIATSWEARRAEREARKADTVKEFLKTIFISANPEVATGRVLSAREFLDAGARRIETELRDQPDVQSEVARVIADAYQALGEYDGVTTLLSADLERRRRGDGAHSVAVANLLRQIADALYEQSRYEQSGQMYEEALTIMRERRGDRSPQVAELLWDLSGVRRNQGDLAGAEALQKQALALYVATSGDDSGDAMAVRESLAITYLQAGRFSEAAALLEPVARWREPHLGPDHPNTLVAWYNVAYELDARGHFDEASRRIEDVIARQRRVIGSRHNRLAASLRLQARVLDSSGRAEAALEPIVEALGITTERFGTDNLQAAHDRTWLALVEAHIGRLADAERDSREALRIFDVQTGPPRADLPYIRTWLGRVLVDAGRLDEGEAIVSSSVAALRAAHHDGVYLGLALDTLGDITRRNGEPARALELAREALPLVEQGLEPVHPAVAVARAHSGAAEWAAGDRGAAERLMRASVVELERTYPHGHPDLAAAWLALGEALLEAHRPVDARPFLQNAFAWRRAHFGEADPRTAVARRALGSVRSR